MNDKKTFKVGLTLVALVAILGLSAVAEANEGGAVYNRPYKNSGAARAEDAGCKLFSVNSTTGTGHVVFTNSASRLFWVQLGTAPNGGDTWKLFDSSNVTVGFSAAVDDGNKAKLTLYNVWESSTTGAGATIGAAAPFAQKQSFVPPARFSKGVTAQRTAAGGPDTYCIATDDGSND